MVQVSAERDARQVFLVARNPQPDTRLPFLVKLPLEGGLVLKVRDVWPATSRVYCHPFEEEWPEAPDILEEVPVLLCRWRGAAIDLVLDRPRLARSQFVFTEVKGRPAIFWQTQKTARTTNPGGRVPRRRALASGFTIAVDTRERYGYRFAGRDVATERAALPAGDYAVRNEEGVHPGRGGAQEPGEPGHHPVGRDPGLPDAAPDGASPLRRGGGGTVPGAALISTRAGRLPRDVLARLQVRYPEVQVVFADSRRFAEEWIYRFLAAVIADATGEPSV